MKLFLKYIWQYRLGFAVLLVFSVIFAIIFSLYELEIEAVLYSALLCASLGAVILTVHYIIFRKKYIERKGFTDNFLLMTAKLPAPSTPAEEQYTKMLEQLRSFACDIQNKYDKERADSIDYYTVWAHQIKIPISVMQMMLEREDTERGRALSAELFRIEQYVEMVLHRFRLDSSSSDFVFRKLPIDEVIRTAIRKYAPLFIRKKIKIIYDGTDAVVLSDEKWLLFIIEQLLSNAVKYTEQGSVCISFTENNILEITDTGSGISAEDMPRIFEKGYTGYNGRIEKKSTGLGLYLCKKAADKLSHKIYVNSEIGVGSTFYVDLNSAKIEIE